MPGLSFSSPATCTLAAGRDLFDAGLIAGNVGTHHDLQIGEATPVVEFDEREPLLGIAARADPAGDFQRLARLARFQNVGDARDIHGMPTASLNGVIE